MGSHNAAGQMLGYLYQVRYALNLLLESEEPGYQISLEKFDDIAFDRDGTAVQLIQENIIRIRQALQIHLRIYGEH